MQRTTLPACAGGTLGSADLLHNLPPAKTTGTTTQCPMRSPSVRRWEMANKFHSNSQQTNLPPSYSKMISVQEKGSSGHHISWLRKAFDTITFNFHIRQMRKLKLNENSQHITMSNGITAQSDLPRWERWSNQVKFRHFVEHNYTTVWDSLKPYFSSWRGRATSGFHSSLTFMQLAARLASAPVLCAPEGSGGQPSSPTYKPLSGICEEDELLKNFKFFPKF